jgi:ABC-type glycerol-3-phosphate transport system permease component
VDINEVGRLFFGIVFPVLGAAVCVAVLVSIHRLIYGPMDPYLLQKFTPKSEEELAVILPAGKILLPLRIVSLAGYLIVTVLLLIGTCIGLAMLRGGILLLRSGKPGAAEGVKARNTEG